MSGRATSPRTTRWPWAVLILCLLHCSCGLTSSVFTAEPAQPGGEDGTPVQVQFSGNESLASFRLLRVIEDRMYDLSRDPEETAVLQDAAFDIEDHYRSEGFPEVSVDYLFNHPVEPSDERPISVEFTIEEGQRVTVSAMRISGNSTFPTDELLPLWLRQHAGTFGLGDPYLVEDDVRGFATTLRMFYRSEGFLSVLVDEPVVTPAGDGASVTVDIEIREGPRFKIHEVTLDDGLRDALGDRTPAPPLNLWARAGTVSEFREQVLTALRTDGYPSPRLFVDIDEVGEQPLVHIHVHGEAGRRGRIAKIRVTGNERTDTDVILSRLELDPGDLYDGVVVDDAVRDIYLSGLFRRIEVDRRWIDDDPSAETEGELDLTITVEEEDSKKIEVLAGYGSYERFRGKVRFEERDLFGTGRWFSAEALVSTKGERGVISIVDPRLFGTRNALSLSGDAFRREEPSFTDQAYGGTIALQRELLQRWTTRIGYTYRKRNGTDIDVDPGFVDVTDYLEGDVFAETAIDLRDSPIFPRSGVRGSIQVDANDPAFGATVEFARLRFSASAYWPVSEKLVFAVRSEQGLLWPGGTSEEVPLQERFYNGGQNSVRSFNEAELGPKDSNGTPVGGEFRNVFSGEARARLIGSLEAALFVDAGNVGSKVENFGLGDMRWGLGGGLRLGLPIGPIRGDLAWNPDRRADEDAWVFHLSVGYPF